MFDLKLRLTSCLSIADSDPIADTYFLVASTLPKGSETAHAYEYVKQLFQTYIVLI